MKTKILPLSISIIFFCEHVKIKDEGDDVWIGGAKILGSVRASNGIVHVVDAIILPD